MSVKQEENGRWRARYRDTAGKSHSQRFDRKSDAEDWLAENRTHIRRGTWVDPSLGRETFRAYADRWLANQRQHSRGTTEATAIRFAHVVKGLGDRRICDIRKSDVEAWIRELEATGKAESTRKAIVDLAATIFKAAVGDRVIPESPFRDVKRTKVGKRSLVIPTVAEVAAIADKIYPRHRAAILLAATSGLRIGEVFGLTVDRVDFLRRTVTVDRQLQTYQNSERWIVPPKTRASWRTVPVPAKTIEVLSAHIAGHERGRAWGPKDARRPGLGGAWVDGLIFTTKAGQPVSRKDFGYVLDTALERAEVTKQLTFHCFRHFYASFLIRRSISVKVVQARLGHEDASTTLDIYGHLWDDDDDRTRDAIGEAFGELEAAAELRQSEEVGDDRAMEVRKIVGE